MKILEIITPDQTLDEGKGIASDIMAKGKQIANDVGEFTGIRALRNAESTGVSKYIDDALNDAGKELKRSKGLAAAEKELLALEKNISLQSGSKKNFDTMAEYLANRKIAKEGDDVRPLGDLDVPTLYIRNDAKAGLGITPENAWMKNLATSKDYDDDFNNWLRQSVNARIKIKQEIKDAKPAAPDKVKKTPEEEVAELELKARKSAADLLIKQNKAAEEALIKWWKLNMLDYAFLGPEVIRIGVQNYSRWEGVEEWEKSGKIPPEVAVYFPKDKKEGGDNSSNIKFAYSNEEERVAQAASWMKGKIFLQTVSQLGGLGAGLFVGKGLLGLGGGTMGKASWLKNLFTPWISLTGWLAKKAGAEKLAAGCAATAAGIQTGLAGMSVAGKFMLADYWASAVTDQNQWSKPLTTYSNMLPDSVYATLKVPESTDVSKAFANLWASAAIAQLPNHDGAFVQWVKNGLIASSVPAQLAYTPLLAAVQAIRRYYPEIGKVVPSTIDGEIPGEPGAPPVKTDTKVKSNDDGSADAVNATKRNADSKVPPAEVKTEPVVTPTEVDTTKSRIDPNRYKK
jgi:hypothetical protein